MDTLKNNNKEVTTFKILNASNMNIYGDVMVDLFNQVKNSKTIEYKKNYDEYSKFNFIKGLGESGLELIDSYALERADKVVGYMIKNLGKNFLSGKNLTQISLPIYINDERTMLEM